jgi:hypothetical protein
MEAIGIKQTHLRMYSMMVSGTAPMLALGHGYQLSVTISPMALLLLYMRGLRPLRMGKGVCLA